MKNRYGHLTGRAGEIIARYLSGATLSELATEFGGSVSGVHDLLKVKGVPTRPIHVAGRKYVLDDGYFVRRPLEPQACYWAGMLITDGCIHRSGGCYKVTLGLKATDRSVVETFVKDLGYSGPIHIRTGPASSLVRRGSSSAVVVISSRPLVESLIELGITPAKTYSAAATEELIASPDFWRGCWDGDGCLGVVKRSGGQESPYMRFITASRRFAEQCLAFCKSVIPNSRTKIAVRPADQDRGFSAAYTVTFSFRMALKLSLAIYGRPGPVMPRKLDLASSIWRHYGANPFTGSGVSLVGGAGGGGGGGPPVLP